MTPQSSTPQMNNVKNTITFLISDLAVTIGNEVHFFASNGTLLSSINIPNAVNLSGTVYNHLTGSILLSDTRNTNLTKLPKEFKTKYALRLLRSKLIFTSVEI